MAALLKRYINTNKTIWMVMIYLVHCRGVFKGELWGPYPLPQGPVKSIDFRKFSGPNGCWAPYGKKLKPPPRQISENASGAQSSFANLGSSECDVSYQYGTRASFQFIRRIPALYILRPKKNLRQLESCQPSSQNEWSVDGWMCCQITTPGR